MQAPTIHESWNVLNDSYEQKVESIDSEAGICLEEEIPDDIRMKFELLEFPQPSAFKWHAGGNFGCAFRTRKLSTKKIYAIKTWAPMTTQLEGSIQYEYHQAIQEGELKIVEALIELRKNDISHDSIIDYIHLNRDPGYLQMEFAQGLPLSMTQAQFHRMCLDVLEGMNFLATLDSEDPIQKNAAEIIKGHGDIKPDNILWKDGRIKLIDFKVDNPRTPRTKEEFIRDDLSQLGELVMSRYLHDRQSGEPNITDLNPQVFEEFTKIQRWLVKGQATISSAIEEFKKMEHLIVGSTLRKAKRAGTRERD